MKDFDIKILEQMAINFDPLPTDDEFLDKSYEWQKNINGVEWPYYRFFYSLSEFLQPSVILELGTYQATASAHFAAPLIETEAIVLTVDHHTDLGDDDNQLKVLAAQDLYPNLIYHRGWTTPRIAIENRGKHALGNVGDVYETIVNHTIFYGKKIDILFIDSWHCYEYAMEDWKVYGPLMSSPGLVICDDIQEGGGPESPIQGMMQFWDELPEPKFLNNNIHPGTNMGFVKC